MEELKVTRGYCFLCGKYPEARVPMYANGAYSIPLCKNCLKKYEEGGRFTYIEHVIELRKANKRIDELENKIAQLESLINTKIIIKNEIKNT